MKEMDSFVIRHKWMFLREFLFKSACNAHISDIYNADLSLASCHKNNEKEKKNNVSFEILSNTIYAIARFTHNFT